MRASIYRLFVFTFFFVPSSVSLGTHLLFDDDQFIVAFDAVISDITGNPQALDLPFPLGTGERIDGQIAFESRDDAIDQLQGDATKFSDLSLTIEGHVIHNLFNVSTTNDGGFIGPIEDIDNPPSSIYFSYFPVSMGTPGWVGSGANVPWTAVILMVGEPGTLEKPSGLLNLDDWNRLERVRDLTLYFGYPNPVVVTATLEDFVKIPEPSSLSLAFFAVAGLGGRIAHRCTFRRVASS